MSSEEDFKDIACYCNGVTKDVVRSSIASGANTLPKIYDSCQAGTGPCGGSCRNTLLSLLLEDKKKASKSEETLPEALIHGVSLFNRHYFWECHEILEDEWMDEVGPKRLFYQGIIQAAASFYHVLNANPKGVIRLSQEARKKLQNYSPVFLKIPVSSLIESLRDFEEQAKNILGGTLAGFDYDKIPKLKIDTGTTTGKTT